MSTDKLTSPTPLYLVFALMLFSFGSMGSARIALALYALALGASPSAVGILLGTIYVFPTLFSWPIGRYSDRVGSRWLLLIGAASGLCAMLIPYFAQKLGCWRLTPKCGLRLCRFLRRLQQRTQVTRLTPAPGGQ